MPLAPEDVVDVAGVLRYARHDGAIWSRNSEDLNVNLMRLSAGAGIPEHVNGELDVLLVVFEGAGELRVDGTTHQLAPGIAVVIPRGVGRALHCVRGPLVYLTAHRQRGGLMPI